jgi:hypothetical protein
MGAGKASVRSSVAAAWWLGTVASLLLLLSIPLGIGSIDCSLRTPFDNTRSGHAAQWMFLSHAAHYVPRGATFTVHAPDRDTEMSLFMMAVGLLPEASPLPSSYYGRSMVLGDRARFVLEMNGSQSEQPRGTRSVAVAGGRISERPVPRP